MNNLSLALLLATTQAQINDALQAGVECLTIPTADTNNLEFETPEDITGCVGELTVDECATNA